MKNMNPIQGTNVSLAIAQIAARYAQDASNLDAARTGMLMDTMRETGAQIVELLEGLGENIDLYV